MSVSECQLWPGIIFSPHHPSPAVIDCEPSLPNREMSFTADETLTEFLSRAREHVVFLALDRLHTWPCRTRITSEDLNQTLRILIVFPCAQVLTLPNLLCPAGERLWLDQVEMPPGLEIAPLPHYKKCPAVTVQSTRVSILAARALAEAEEGGGGGKKKK
jgi:hypothetical protein